MSIISATATQKESYQRLEKLPYGLRAKAKAKFLQLVGYSERTLQRRIKEEKFTPDESDILTQVLDTLEL